MIQIADLKPGYLYRLNARNIRMGVFIPGAAVPEGEGRANLGNKAHFIGIRTKFGSRFLDKEFHYDADPHFGTAEPLEDIAVCPLQNLEEEQPLFDWLEQMENEFPA